MFAIISEGINNYELILCPDCIWQARGKVSEIINNAIVHYRDDLDLQNLIDFGQKKVPAKCGVITQCPVGRVKMLVQGTPHSLGLWTSFTQ